LLKPNTSLNIVIGGIAGAMAPVGAWTAATGSMAFAPWVLFLIIFFWTPPHFWSLALCFKDDYRKANLPMLPVIKGDDSTLKQIFYYSLALFAISMTPLLIDFSWLYLGTATVLGVVFIKKSIRARNMKSNKPAWDLFRFSIIYLFALFLALILGTFV
jgi:protoheme IX farnesyltransferase